MKNSARELPLDALDGLAHVPFDDALDVLGHKQRRKLLFALLDHNPLGDSPAILVDSEDEAGPIDQFVAMNHVHLPKLVEYGFIVWNRDAHEVVKGPGFDAIEPLLELLADHEDELPDGWL